MPKALLWIRIRKSFMDISVVIVNYNTRELLLKCIASIYRTGPPLGFEIWVVDNASVDGSLEAVRHRFPDVKIIQNEKNRGFAAANNQALKRMGGCYALLLNSDAVLKAGAMETLFRFMEGHKEAGMACGQLLNADGSRQNSFANFPTLLSLTLNESLLKRLWPSRYPSKYQTYRKPLAVESCIGACMMVRRTAMETAGLLDERYFFFLEETDWALTFCKAGFRTYFIPEASIYHYQGQSAGNDANARIMFFRSRYQFIRKWHCRAFPFYFAVIGLRLLADALLSLVATVATLGLHDATRLRCIRYLKIGWWHVKGCP